MKEPHTCSSGPPAIREKERRFPYVRPWNAITSPYLTDGIGVERPNKAMAIGPSLVLEKGPLRDSRYHDRAMGIRDSDHLRGNLE